MTNVLKNQFNQVCEILNKYNNNHYKLICLCYPKTEPRYHSKSDPQSNGDGSFCK